VVVAERPLLVEKETNERGSFAVVCARRLSRVVARGEKERSSSSCSSWEKVGVGEKNSLRNFLGACA
jgi:hypothetical protein